MCASRSAPPESQSQSSCCKCRSAFLYGSPIKERGRDQRGQKTDRCEKSCPGGDETQLPEKLRRKQTLPSGNSSQQHLLAGGRQDNKMHIGLLFRFVVSLDFSLLPPGNSRTVNEHKPNVMRLSKLLKKKLHLTASASMKHIFSYDAKLTYSRCKEI